MRHLIISALISLDQELSENIWFVWSKTSYSGDVTDAGQRQTTTSEDTATQLLICETLSLAMRVVTYESYNDVSNCAMKFATWPLSKKIIQGK